MSDIDFEELDKAVNNITGNNGTKPSVPPATEADQPSFKASPQISQKPRGRFMDVLHPSSDMMGKENLSPSRKTVSPIVNNKPGPAVHDNQVVADVSEPVVKNDWPDPIDAAPVAEAEMETSETAADNGDIADKLDAASLFLPGAKVDKRPLGGFNADSTENDEQPGETKEIPPNSPNPIEKNDSVPVSLPPELEADLVAIEEGGLPSNDLDFPADSFETGEKAISSDITDNGETEAKKIDSEPVATPPPTKAPDIDPKPSGFLAAGSIPQQYKTAAVSAETSVSHPIFFDADHHDTALSQGAHKKTGSTTLFQWIFIIVGLLLLGATLGAALFIFVSSK